MKRISDLKDATSRLNKMQSCSTITDMIGQGIVFIGSRSWRRLPRAKQVEACKRGIYLLKVNRHWQSATSKSIWIMNFSIRQRKLEN